MRRIYVRQTEYEVIDSMYEGPTQNEPQVYLPLPESEKPRTGAGFWAIVLVIAALLIVFGPKVEVSRAHAQQGVCNFYGVCNRYGPGPTVNVYPQTIIVVPQQSQSDPPLVRDKDGVPLACNWNSRGCHPSTTPSQTTIFDY